MSLRIAERDIEGISIVDLKGRLVAGDEAATLREFVQTKVPAGPVNAVLNLRDIEFIDSTGLGAMVIAYTTAKKSGGALKLLHLNRRDVELLVLTKLDTIFETFDDEQDSVNSFFPDREVRRFDILSFVQSHSKD